MKHLCHPGPKLSSLGTLVLVSSFCLLGRICVGQDGGATGGAAAAPQWLEGPATADLGGIAQLTIPAGYHFGGREVAASLLKGRMPKNLVGILSPVNSQWFGLLEYAGEGYVSDKDAGRLDPAVMLSGVKKNLGGQGAEGAAMAASAEWVLKPVYDAAGNRLEWAVRAGGEDNATINYSVCLLGRRGVLEMVVVLPDRPEVDLGAVRDVATGLSFHDGQRYADFAAGDTMAPVTMAALVAGGEPSNGGILAGVMAHRKVVAAAGLGVACLGLASIALAGRRKARRQGMGARAERVPVVHTNGNGHAHSDANGSAKVPENGAQRLALAARENGQRFKNDNRKRKKHFRYHAFYSEMVMKLSSSNYGASNGGFSGGELTESVGALTPTVSASARRSVEAGRSEEAETLARETAKLIEGQQKLIEGYRKLIDEQNKLMDEKSRLIAAENQVMEKQAQLLEEQQLL